MTIWKSYHVAHSITDALEALASAPDAARLVAGGTDLLLDLQQGRHAPVHTLVDVSEIPEMKVIEERVTGLYIGAAVPLNQVVASRLVWEHCRALHEAAALIGGPQVRNTATLGGNVAHALPAGDGTIALLALGAEAEIAGRAGRRRAAIGELFLGPGRSTLEAAHELLVGFHLPLRKVGEASAFQRVMRPQGVAIAILNLGAWLRREGERIAEVRIGVGPAGPTPFRARAAEESLAGRGLDLDSLRIAGEALLSEARFRTSPHRATAQYRVEMAQVLLEDVLRLAWERARSRPID